MEKKIKFSGKKNEELLKWRKEYKEVLGNEKYFEWLIDYADRRDSKEELIDLYDPNILPEEMEKVVLIPKLFEGLKEYGTMNFIPEVVTTNGSEFVLEYKHQHFVFGRAKITNGTFYYFKMIHTVKNAIPLYSIIGK